MPSTITSGASTLSFISLSGQPQSEGIVPEEITRVGTRGVAVRQLAMQAQKFQLIGVRDCDDQAAAAAFYRSLLALQGKVVELITDDYNTSIANCIIWEVVMIDRKPLIAASGGLSALKGALLTVAILAQKAVL